MKTTEQRVDRLERVVAKVIIILGVYLLIFLSILFF